jgi:cathepsin D
MYFSLAMILAVVSLVVSAATKKPHATIPLNKRTNINRSDGSVDFNVLKRQTYYSTAYVISCCKSLRMRADLAYSKILRGLSNYEHNTGQRHPLSHSIKDFKRAVASNPLIHDEQSSLWIGSISVGTPPIKFTVDFDTGTSDFFLPDIKCANCGDHTRYNSSASSTSKPVGEPFSIQYSDGENVFRPNVSGALYNDAVTVGSLTATRQILGAATQYAPNLEALADGVMGMAFQSISAYNATPFWQSVFAEDQMDSPVFALKLAASGSELTIGGLNSTLYTGNVTFVPVDVPGYWQTNFTSLTVAGKSIVNNTSCIIDSVSSPYDLVIPLD